MNWTQIGTAAVAIFIIWYFYRRRGGIKALFQQSREAPQHWGTFALLMLGVVVFVYLLIKL